MSETNAQTKTSDQGLLAAGFFVGLTPLYYAKINNLDALQGYGKKGKFSAFRRGGGAASPSVTLSRDSSPSGGARAFDDHVMRRPLKLFVAI